MIKTIIVTGSTRGIGFGMAQAFLRRGQQVVICGRSQASTDAAVARLSADHDPRRILGQACDVGEYAQVERLWQAASEHFGTVDIWINNAGLTNANREFWHLDPQQIGSIVSTNVRGVMNGAHVALNGMVQQGHGHIYTMEGLGSDGRVQPKLIVYGATKAAVTSFTKGLIKETATSPVNVSFLSPGMVVTDLLLGDATLNERTRRVFNILADRVETVAPWLADQVLANDEHGARIAWLTTPKIAWRFATAPFIKRDILPQ